MAIALTACQPAPSGPATPQEISVGAGIAQARGHLAAALSDARSGRWDLAVVHAAHPAETLPGIDSALARRDGPADAALRKVTADVVAVAQARDLADLERLIGDADQQLARVAGVVMGQDRATEIAYRASVVATLAEAVADEYSAAVVNGRLVQELEYQDAYAFLGQALPMWSDIDASVARASADGHARVAAAFVDLHAAIPGLQVPAALLPADRVVALAGTVHEALRDAVGARTGVAAAGADELKALTKALDTAHDALRAGEIARARASFHEFETGWVAIEDGIRGRDREAYVRIESGMRAMSEELTTPEHPDTARADAAVIALDEAIDDALPRIAAGSSGARSLATFTSARGHLDDASLALDRGDAAGASAAIVAFRTDWTDIESIVKARSTAAYGAIENDTAAALSDLAKRPADAAGAREAVARIRTAIEPFAASAGTYGAFDAAIILLREGFEALLVIAALLAFLAKSGNADKRRWIWAGGGAGIVGSIGVAILVNVAFAASTAAGANREILEGFTGLFAAAMLVYMSYWMHSKANLSSWQRYIRDKSSSALARNSLLSLALIAFLAVFREGAETALFYLGIAPSIAFGDLAIGLAIGTAGLAALGVVMLVFGVRIPIRPFFLFTSLLVYYLALKFVGAGVHALQVAGIVPATSERFLPEIGFFGVFPTWETTAVQVALLAAALGFIAFERARATRRPESVSAI